jgi:hypothetical protein
LEKQKPYKKIQLKSKSRAARRCMEMTAERKGVQLTPDRYSVQYINQCDYTYSDMKKKNTVHCPIKTTSAIINKCQTNRQGTDLKNVYTTTWCITLHSG